MMSWSFGLWGSGVDARKRRMERKGKGKGKRASGKGKGKVKGGSGSMSGSKLRRTFSSPVPTFLLVSFSSIHPILSRSDSNRIQYEQIFLPLFSFLFSLSRAGELTSGMIVIDRPEISTSISIPLSSSPVQKAEAQESRGGAKVVIKSPGADKLRRKLLQKVFEVTLPT